MPALPAHHHRCDAGGAVAGFLVAILVLAGIAVAAFFYFGGEADVDVDVKQPDVTVTSDETPS